LFFARNSSESLKILLICSNRFQFSPARVVAAVPTELNRRLLAGEIDVAPISSIEYARNADRLRLLPRLCVGSEGAVDSIQLVSRKPLEQVRSVAITPESATSVVLTKVLLPEAEHVRLGEEADAKLLIGDAALKSAFEDPTPHYDLGRLWLERTGLPMVFAVWACPEPVADGLADLEDALVSSVRQARAEPSFGELFREYIDRYAKHHTKTWEDNMKRIAICWSELASCGIAASLHLNARTDRDWER